MAKLTKCPTPRNFSSKKVSVSIEEANSLRDGYYKQLVIMKYKGEGEIFLTKRITQNMIDSLEDKGDYYLMRYTGF